MDAVLHALADQSRRTVMEILRDHPATAGELAEALPIARPGVSRHLRVLREAGLVEVRQEAQRRIYSLRPQALVEVDEWLEGYRALWQNRLAALHTEVARGGKAQRGGESGRWGPSTRRVARFASRTSTTPTSTTCGRRARSRTGWRAGSPRCPATCARAGRCTPSSRARGPARRGSRCVTRRTTCCSRRARARTRS